MNKNNVNYGTAPKWAQETFQYLVDHSNSEPSKILEHTILMSRACKTLNKTDWYRVSEYVKYIWLKELPSGHNTSIIELIKKHPEDQDKAEVAFFNIIQMGMVGVEKHLLTTLFKNSPMV